MLFNKPEVRIGGTLVEFLFLLGYKLAEKDQYFPIQTKSKPVH